MRRVTFTTKRSYLMVNNKMNAQCTAIPVGVRSQDVLCPCLSTQDPFSFSRCSVTYTTGVSMSRVKIQCIVLYCCLAHDIHGLQDNEVQLQCYTEELCLNDGIGRGQFDCSFSICWQFEWPHSIVEEISCVFVGGQLNCKPLELNEGAKKDQVHYFVRTIY